MRLLLDTHVLLWFLEDDSRLSRRARQAIEDPANEQIISVASGWEIAIKLDLGKLTLPMAFHELFPARLEELGFSILPIVPSHLHALIGLPTRHRDPFDRLLAAQAKAEGLTLLTADPNLSGYGLPVLW